MDHSTHAPSLATRLMPVTDRKKRTRMAATTMKA